jgi:hypothetical protein
MLRLAVNEFVLDFSLSEKLQFCRCEMSFVTRGQACSLIKSHGQLPHAHIFRFLCKHYTLYTRSELVKNISHCQTAMYTFTIFQVYVIYDIISVVNTMYTGPSLAQGLQSRSCFILIKLMLYRQLSHFNGPNLDRHQVTPFIFRVQAHQKLSALNAKIRLHR